MATTQVHSTHRTGAGNIGTDSRTDEVSFLSTCPRCTREQLEQVFSRAAVQRLLDSGYPVEAHCVMCDQYWPISAQERAAVARRLGAEKNSLSGL